jgi:transposase-like protein
VKRRKVKRTYTPKFKAEVVRRVLKGRQTRTETQRSIADELGITEQLVSTWTRKAEVQKALAEEPAPPSPTLELRGLRAWVRHEVRLEFDRLVAEKGKR